MPALTTVVTHATGDVFPATDWNIDVRDNMNYLIVAGANLASASSLVTTNEFHQVTGVTTVDSLSPATPVAGQQIRLLFQGALTVRNNGGGTGNIRTLSGGDRPVKANEIVVFNYDGAVWREAAGTAPKITVSTLAGGPPASPADGDYWVATNTDGSGGRPVFQYDTGEATYKWKFLGGAPFYATGTISGSAGASVYQTICSVAPPRAGDYEIVAAIYGTWTGGGAQSQSDISVNAVEKVNQNGVGAGNTPYLYKAAAVGAAQVIAARGIDGPATWSYTAFLAVRPVKVI